MKKINNKGFTIIELVISSAIMAIIFGGVTLFGIQVLQSYQRNQALKNTMENASFAIEALNKTIRTSHTVDGGGSEVFIIDNNSSNSYCYSFGSDKLRRKTGADSATSCSDIGGAFSDIVGSGEILVSGSFAIKQTDRSAGERGFVRTNIRISHETDAIDNFDDDEIIIQSSVSLRDYGYNN